MEEKRHVLSSDSSEWIFGKHSGFRKLRAYQLAELCYDFTCRFCERYIPKEDRHHDQMVQAARSGFQNIREGSELSATTKKLELNLTNVARGSLGELHKDYKKYLQRKRLPLWERDNVAMFTEARNLHPESLTEAAEWINSPDRTQSREERAANLGAVLSAQAHYLAEKLMARQAEDFEKSGGFSERLYKARTAHRQAGEDGSKREDK
ncbi:MAG: four helix bundle protein [Spartobacteria bacterium]|nr:four helix bundle protein [Spartobacteria bacterium]